VNVSEELACLQVSRNLIHSHTVNEGQCSVGKPTFQQPTAAVAVKQLYPHLLTKVEVSAFRRDLTRWRGLRTSLQHWSDAFFDEHGRRPSKSDIAHTEIPWLVDTHREYSLLKDRLVMRMPFLHGDIATRARNELPGHQL
jgi:hypothetical protein